MKLKKGAFAKINAKAKTLLAMDADLTPDEIKELVQTVAENIEHTVEDEDEVGKVEGAEDEEETAEDESEVTEADREQKPADDEDEEADKEDKKAAMDAALKSAEDKAVKRVTALFEAREMVKPLVGVVAMDSAIDVYKHALKKSGVDSAGVESIAGLKSMVGLVLKQKSQPQVKTAMDHASYEDDALTSRFK